MIAPQRVQANIIELNLRLPFNTIGSLGFKASKIEFKLPKPSYTTDTLAHLTEKFPLIEFSLIMGADNLTNLHKWKNANFLINNH